MNTPTQQWESIYRQVPLSDVPRHYAGIQSSPFMLEYLSTILRHCPLGGTTLETGTGSGYGPIWLSLRGVDARGFDLSAPLVERAHHINAVLGGSAQFGVGDLFHLYPTSNPSSASRFDVIHHQGVLEHFCVPQIRAALAQQVACARWVVFSVPSVNYPFDPEFGDERLLPLEEWQRILEPFEIEELRYYGDPQHGEREHVLAVLRGQEVTPELLDIMQVGSQPYPAGISAIVHTRNEAARLGECLESLQGWVDEIIVCDMESEDETVAIAQAHGAQVIHHPRIANFDRARNVSAMRAKYRWVFFLDADERAPAGLGAALRQITEKQDALEAAGKSAELISGLLIPFRHHFVGHWMRSLYPGYTAPRLLRNGRFSFNARLHSGANVDGPVVCFPADDPNLAIVHFSYDSLSHYLTKLNGYTDGEALSMHRDGAPFHWQNAIRHFVGDFQSYYQGMRADQDGVHGFLYSFLSGFYRFEQHAKLYEHRYRSGHLSEAEKVVPADIVEMLEFALQVAKEKPLPRAEPVPLLAVVAQEDGESEKDAESGKEEKGAEGASVSVRTDSDETNSGPTNAKNSSPTSILSKGLVWSAPLLDPSGYGEESRNFVFGLDELGVNLTAQVLPWSHDVVDMSPSDAARLEELRRRPVAPGFTHVVHNLAPGLSRHPQSGISIGRTMFETDRLPQDWVRACNRMDHIWVPSEFHRTSFAGAGVSLHKLAVIPAAIDVAAQEIASSSDALQAGVEALPTDERTFIQSLLAEKAAGKYHFLTAFDWTLHKGWDVLLRGLLAAFEGRKDVVLLLRTWSTMNYGAQGIQDQAARLIQEQLGYDLLRDPRIRFLPNRLSRAGLSALYATADSFVLPSRGEGWGRPYMEAMASGKPVIGTNWSGNTAFMTAENSYLLAFELRDVPEMGWREISTYRGHRWAEPDADHLVHLLREVEGNREESAARGRFAREDIFARFNRRVVAQKIVEELERIGVAQEANADLPATLSPATTQPSNEPAEPVTMQWEGALFNWHSLGQVNREMTLALLKPEPNQPSIELSFVPTEPFQFSPEEDPRFSQLAKRCFAPLSHPAQVHVRHFFPPRFERPAAGQSILIQPWEYGYLPTDWIGPIRDNVDQVWCYSEYVRRVYLDSGIQSEKVQVVPLGIDPEVFHPAVPPYVFTSEPGAKALWNRNSGEGKEGSSDETFVFLYVGGTIQRKGFDILLEAYRRAFTRLDDVCLVIKDTGTGTVYQSAHSRDTILERLADPTHPPLVYIDEDLASAQLAGLFATGDCLVAPYRGEGFCLPVLEAMACGTPVVVPQGGPTDDFVDESVGWLIPAEHKPFEVGPSGKGKIGPWECCGPTWMFEVDPDVLARVLRKIVNARQEVKRRGEAARQRTHSSWTWNDSARHARKALALLDLTTPVSEVAIEKVPKVSERQDETTLQATPRPAPRISLVMIVRNEERVLGDCLRSASPWFDEVIVVDTGSTDSTVQIATELGAKVFHFPWCDDFSAARNVSLEHATGDWVFWMDADDTIPAESGLQLHKLAELAEEKVSGFIVPVHIPPAQGETGFTIVDHVKLFRNIPQLRFVGRIHEQLLEPIHKAGGTVERSNAYVVHSGYDYSPAGQVHKRERDMRILEKDLADRPDHPFVLFNIGMTAYHTKDYERAVPTLLRCLEKSGPKESTVRKVYAMLAGCHLEQGQAKVAKQWVEKGLSQYPHDPELLFRAGIVYRECGELEKAVQSYLKLLGSRETGHIDSLDVTMTGFKAHHNLALIYMDMGRPDAAESHFRAAVTDNSKFVPSWGGLREALLVQQKFGEVQIVENVLTNLSIH